MYIGPNHGSSRKFGPAKQPTRKENGYFIAEASHLLVSITQASSSLSIIKGRVLRQLELLGDIIRGMELVPNKNYVRCNQPLD